MAEMKTPQGLVVGLILDNSFAPEEEQQGANEQIEGANEQIEGANEQIEGVVEKPKRGRKPSEV